MNLCKYYISTLHITETVTGYLHCKTTPGDIKQPLNIHACEIDYIKMNVEVGAHFFITVLVQWFITVGVVFMLI